jgi:hypothetical protein
MDRRAEFTEDSSMNADLMMFSLPAPNAVGNQWNDDLQAQDKNQRWKSSLSFSLPYWQMLNGIPVASFTSFQ